NRAAAFAGDHAIIAVGAEIQFLIGDDVGEEFIDQKVGVFIAEAVVFVAAIEAGQGSVAGKRGDDAGRNEDANHRRHFFFVDEIIQDVGGVETNAILHDEQRCRLGGIVLLRNVNPVSARGAGKNFALVEGMNGDF